ncbi:Uu.00g077090.m01.CDS01 [Anthostomella pinea]|uniref:Uu.00g077090.m01.CDS01 n=1 Tax=Anthostomella pinea TaxID=933095 RepID=A0AAI8VVZ6_9PEZI|nr:Uu.00g077090.m01.CDS01 [Anthostomella pinea]
MHRVHLLVGIFSAFLAYAVAVSQNTLPTLTLPVETVFQFGEIGTWIENLVIRKNGHILFTTVSPNASLYQLACPCTAKTEATLVHHFANITALTGIDAVTDDTFVVLGGNTSAPGTPILGTWSAWEVTFGVDAAALFIQKIVDLPGDVMPNGIALVPKHPNILLITDSKGGSILRLDRAARTCEPVIQLPVMEPAPHSVPAIGINGLKIRDGFAYWTNSFASTIYRTCIDDDGLPCGGDDDPQNATELVAVVRQTWLDDVTFGGDGTMWLATNPNNTVVAISAEGKQVVVAGSGADLGLAGATALAFGRTAIDADVLYVTTSGGLALPINGTVVEPGKVVAVNTGNWKEI